MAGLLNNHVRPLAMAVAAALCLLGFCAAPSLAAASSASVSTFDSLATIRSDRPLPAGGQQTAQISAAGNEFESFQIAVQAGSSGLSGVNVSGAALQGPGNATIPASDLTIYREANYQVTQRSDAEGDVGSWPDALIPQRDTFYGEDRNAFPFDVPAGGKLAVWVDVLVPANAAPGDYSGTFTVRDASGQIADVPVHLNVYPFSIPSTSSLPSLFQISGVSLPGGDQTLFAAAALDNRVTIANLWPFPDSRFKSQILPLLQGTDSRVRLPDAKLTALEAYHCATNCLAQWRDLADRYPVVGQRFIDYICDEPSSSAQWSDCNSTAAAADQIWPGVRKLLTSDAAYTPSWATDLSPLVNDMVRDGGSAYSSWQAGGSNRGSWAYTSCRSYGCAGAPESASEDNGWPGYAIDEPASQARAMGWLAFSQGSTGELYWNTTSKISTAWTDQSESGGNGDGNLFYPGTPDVIGGTHAIPIESIRLKRIRDGREDYEYMHILAQQGRGSEAAAVARSLFPSWRQTTVSPAALSQARDTLAAMIGGQALPDLPQLSVSDNQVGSGDDSASASDAPQSQAGKAAAAPRADITAGPSGETRDRTPTFRFASDRPDASFQCRVDRRRWRNCSSGSPLKSLALRRHTFSVRARDAGSSLASSPQKRSFEVVGLEVAGRSAHS